ncbi:MAG: hypothetical protein GWN84_21265 [Gammaproteobacteria bacterium]|nr:hypothetical protein [Gammaproteobacteria bacterium]NIR85252.1 hypothetical protein [Gammaproteobacteria bacterium]NIR88371.1 hypothetical protein [Gammaproteobacteria bacterium]NIU06321.1 hypothetical protein [Gammaproteobacteria bacterium]NIV53220.1 hypothetical protein [Gammaproteobacteria bacterium]
MTRSLITAMLLAMCSGVVLAAPPAFEDVDANADGAISQREAGAVEGLDFKQADTNQDGALSKKEYQAATKS